jgi:hypothetical protein
MCLCDLLDEIMRADLRKSAKDGGFPLSPAVLPACCQVLRLRDQVPLGGEKIHPSKRSAVVHTEGGRFPGQIYVAPRVRVCTRAVQPK